MRVAGNLPATAQAQQAPAPVQVSYPPAKVGPTWGGLGFALQNVQTTSMGVPGQLPAHLVPVSGFKGQDWSGLAAAAAAAQAAQQASLAALLAQQQGGGFTGGFGGTFGGSSPADTTGTTDLATGGATGAVTASPNWSRIGMIAGGVLVAAVAAKLLWKLVG
jgi:hypothetical protein